MHKYIIFFVFIFAIKSFAVTIYVSPVGSDINNGLSLEAALASLEGAQNTIRKIESSMGNVSNDISQDYIVKILPGTYYGQSIKWELSSENHSITFMSEHFDLSRAADEEYFPEPYPVFDGKKSDGSLQIVFFDFRRRDGKASNLKFYGLQIENYQIYGFLIFGDMYSPNLGTSHNVIQKCYFAKIGNKETGGDPGMAAVDLINSSHNVVSYNYFEYIENTKDLAHNMHGVYLAHFSRNNTVTHNKFFRVSGDVIRFRDNSHDNQISHNDSERSGHAAFVGEWYNKPTNEQRSWRNLVKSNYVLGGYDSSNKIRVVSCVVSSPCKKGQFLENDNELREPGGGGAMGIPGLDLILWLFNDKGTQRQPHKIQKLQ